MVVSGSLGPRIIGSGLVGKFGFEIYGGAGKALLFAAVTFGLLSYRTGHQSTVYYWHRRNVVWGIGAVGLYVLSWVAITRLQHADYYVVWPILVHLGLVGAIVTLFLMVIGWHDIQLLIHDYKRELIISIIIAAGFLGFLELVYNLWKALSSTVMYVVRWLLERGGIKVYIIPPRTLLLPKFAVEISQFCSGIESIALFTGLYAIVGIIDRQRLNFRRYLAVFVPALTALFACNILRVYLLILAAYYINPRIAFSLFHTYAGMIFFIVYSGVFWWLCYNWLLKRPAGAPIEHASLHS